MDLILRICQGLRSRAEAAILRARGARLDGAVWLRAVDVPRNAWDIHLGDGVALDRGVSLIATGRRTGSPRIVIAARTYINRHTIIDASELITIGSDCLLGPHCYLTDHDHALTGDRKSGLRSLPTRLDDGVWLGAHVTVLKGTRIGARSVIGAGSVVTRDIPAECVAVGAPAKVVRKLDPDNPTHA